MDGFAAVCALLLLPFFGLVGAVLVAVWQSKARVDHSAKPMDRVSLPRMIFLVPAHDEEKGIETTVRSLLEQEYPSDLFKVFVIADNCTDQTAARALVAGAFVLERTDPEHRGKGFALEFALEALDRFSYPWEGVVIIDADSVLGPGVLRVFADNLSQGHDWQQGYYTVSNSGESWRTKLVTVALALFNGIWPAGMDELGIGSPLRGNGMAFSRRGLRRRSIKAYGLAEDLELSWRLRLAGEHVHFVPQAIIRGAMVARSGSSAASQRLRWERGRTAVRRQFSRMIWKAASHSLGWRIIATLDLYFPPLAGLSTWLFVSAVLAVAFGSQLASILVAFYSVVLMLYLLTPFFIGLLPLQYLRALAYSPIYMGWKLYLRFLPGPRQWVRTARE
jgi:cellulose synthase/poly-beta-1,6-N-acetylglucosamine synthase-like glycosyltransferase